MLLGGILDEGVSYKVSGNQYRFGDNREFEITSRL